MVDRSVESSETRNIIHIDANNMFDWSMSQNLPYKEFQLSNDVSLNNIVETDD